MGKKVNKNRITYIYTLEDPLTKKIRYIGKTVKPLDKRLAGHIYDCKRTKTHKSNWIKSLLKKNVKPIINLLDESEWQYSQDLEIFWISQFKTWGANLTNHSNGGEGYIGKRTKEHLKNQSKGIREAQKTVYQYTLDGEFLSSFRSCIDAAESINGRAHNISQCCLFNKKSHKGFIWSYLEQEIIDLSKYKRLPNPGNKTITNNFVQKSRKVIVTNLETGEEIIANSLKEASEFSGVSKPGICCECKGLRKTKGKYEFKYKK